MRHPRDCQQFCPILVDNNRMRATIDFCLNGERVSVADEDPARTLLTWLRDRRRLIGTKEGCAEGDCGACTVVLADIDPSGALRYQPVNSCILCLGALDGKEVITVEGLKGGHPVQRAMVERHGSQCGFCTPGFVMALYAHHKSGERTPAADAIAGNLCRCTGYRPILDAAERVCALADAAEERTQDKGRVARLKSLPKDSFRVNGFFAPTKLAELASFLARHPKATLLAGGTDVGLWITKQHRDLEKVAYVGKVRELKT